MKKIIGVLLIAALFSCKKPDGKLSGVVTYYFNSNFGDKPDVGAKIFINNMEDIDSSKMWAVKKYKTVLFSRTTIEWCKERIRNDSARIKSSTQYLSLKGPSKEDFDRNREVIQDSKDNIAKRQKEFEEVENQLKKINISSDKDFLELADSVSSQVKKFEFIKTMKSFVADGNGAYSTNLPPGEYLVLFISNHRQGETIADVDGRIDLSFVKVESEKEVTANANFSVDF